jgi:hypothetical protein
LNNSTLVGLDSKAMKGFFVDTKMIKMTPLHIAVQIGSIKEVKSLLENRANIFARTTAS